MLKVIRLIVSLFLFFALQQSAFGEIVEEFEISNTIIAKLQDKWELWTAYKDLQTVLKQKNITPQQERSLRIWKLIDIDKDGTRELVALVEYKQDESKRAEKKSTLWIFKKNKDTQKFIKIHEIPNIMQCSSCADDLTQSLYQENGNLTLCEQWRLDTLLNQECNTVQLTDNWDLSLIKYRLRQVWLDIPAENRATFDFDKKYATREYAHMPAGSYLPIKRKKNQYQMLFSTWQTTPPTIDGVPTKGEWCPDLQTDPLECYDKNKNLDVKSSWNPNFIHFGIWVKDSTPVSLPNPCSPAADIQRVDHLAVWLDLATSLTTDDSPKEEWEDTYQRQYGLNPYRHEMDENIVAIAITRGENTCFLHQHPPFKTLPTTPQMRVSQVNQNGYFVEVEIPATLFGIQDFRQYDARIDGIGFTALAHDVTKWNTLDEITDSATSAWQWGDPYSLGQLWLMPPNVTSLPKYPLNWDNWLK